MAFIDQSQQGRPKSLQRKITMLSKVHVIWTWALLSYVYFRECALWEQKGKRTLSWLKTIISTMHKKAKKKEYSCVVLVRASWYEIMSTQASLSRHNFLCCFATGHSLTNLYQQHFQKLALVFMDIIFSWLGSMQLQGLSCSHDNKAKAITVALEEEKRPLSCEWCLLRSLARWADLHRSSYFSIRRYTHSNDAICPSYSLQDDGPDFGPCAVRALISR